MSAQPEKLHIDELHPEEHRFLEEYSLAELRERIRVELLAHLALIGLDPPPSARDQTCTKDVVRARHAAQRDAVVRPAATTIGASAVNRWLIPRAQPRLDYQQWTRKAIWEQLIGRTYPWLFL